MRFDATLKDLFRTGPRRLIELLTGTAEREPLPSEYTALRKRELDWVARLDDGRLYHLELQSSNDRQMDWRMLDCYTLLFRQYGEAPFQQVLYVGEAPLSMPASIDHQYLQFRYELVDIR